MFLLVILVHLVCWTPFQLDNLLVAFRLVPLYNMACEQLKGYRMFSNMLLAANSCLNPVLYCFISEQFRLFYFIFGNKNLFLDF